MRTPKVAVIGPFFNDAEHVRPWLDALAKQTFGDFTVYLVDDASTDATPEQIATYLEHSPLKVRFFPLRENQGAAGARNVALQAALDDGADLLLLLDSDCRADIDWLERHVRLQAAHPEIGVIGGAIQGVARSFIGKADGFSSWFTGIPYSKSTYMEKLHLSSTNMSLKRQVFYLHGLFDADLATGEDVAFCRRVQKAGTKLWFQSDIVVRHLDRDERQAAKNHHYRWGLHSYTLSIRRHGGYYGILTRLPHPALALFLVPLMAVANTGFIVLRFFFQAPSVLLYVPGILYLKWWNALGVYRGFRRPETCLRTSHGV